MDINKFIRITGETPKSLIGDDWEEYDLDDWMDDEGYTHEGHEVGNCFICKDGI